MKHTLTPALIALLASISPLSAKDLTIVPYPKNVKVQETRQYEVAPSFRLNNGFTISAPAEFSDAADLFVEDSERLYRITGKAQDDKGNIRLVKDDSLAAEEYKVIVKPQGILVKAANYKAIVMGLTTVMQLVNDKNHSIPVCEISDSPQFPFRGYMLDVARNWSELETLRHMVDICRWYKLPYFHLHLSDDQLWVFESKAYPQLTEGKKCYTQEQLKELVEYAKKRGVAIIPEFDLPGHSTALRWMAPDVFGDKNWGVVDMVNPECVKALKTVAKEMMDVFYTSPYFHIGADEVWLAGYQELDHVKEYLAANKDKFDSIHDVFYNFIVEMHEFVKSQGKETIAWEGFGGSGSAKVPIPKDIIVVVWDAVYNNPHYLTENGYRVINSSFKPTYTQPERCYSPQYTYDWNPRRWNRYRPIGWKPLPEYQLKDNTNLLGLQMSSWEGIDQQFLLTVKSRLPIISEQGWNDTAKKPYAEYVSRAADVDKKLMTLIFPATEERSGFEGPCKIEMNYNQINEFRQAGTTFFKPLNSSDYITYTMDGTLPTPESSKMTEPLTLKANALVKYHMYDKEGNLKAYKVCDYRMRPIEAQHKGLLKQWDETITINVLRTNFLDEVEVTLINHHPDTNIHYAVGKVPTAQDPIYTEPLKYSETSDFWATCFDKDGKQVGSPFNAWYVKTDKEAWEESLK